MNHEGVCRTAAPATPGLLTNSVYVFSLFCVCLKGVHPFLIENVKVQTNNSQSYLSGRYFITDHRIDALNQPCLNLRTMDTISGIT